MNASERSSAAREPSRLPPAVIALDTNILARVLLADDAKQLAQARELLSRAEDFTAPVTVMLELVWVLETYELSASDIASGLHKLLALPNFKPAQEAQLRAALSAYAQGMDFADALHLQLSAPAKAFVTLDRKLVAKAAKQKSSVAPPAIGLAQA